MARIAGVNLPLNKRSEIGLTYIYGIGRATAKEILEHVDVSPDTYVRDLTEDEVAKLRAAIDDGRTVEGDLRRERSQDIKRLQEIGCYRGLRHRRAEGLGAGLAEGGRVRQGPRFGPRDGDPLAAGGRLGGERGQGRHAPGPQRLPAPQAQARVGAARSAERGRERARWQETQAHSASSAAARGRSCSSRASAASPTSAGSSGAHIRPASTAAGA